MAIINIGHVVGPQGPSSTDLKYNGTTKVVATNTGINVVGQVNATSFVGDGSQLTNTPTNALGTRTTLFDGNSGTSADIALTEPWDTFDELIFYMTNDGSDYGLKYEILVQDMITAATYASGAEFLIVSHVYFWIRTAPRTYLSVRTENSRMRKIIGVNY